MYLCSEGSFGLRRPCTEVRPPTFWLCRGFVQSRGIPPQLPQKGDFYLFIFISLIAGGSHHYHPACGKDLPISPRFMPYGFLSRCKFGTLTTCQPMVQFYLLTFPRFPLRKKEHKSYFGKSRSHDFRATSYYTHLVDFLRLSSM